MRPDDRLRLLAGRYEVHRVLGRGGMALVFEAYDRERGERVALKRLVKAPDEAKHARHLALFEREYHTLAELAHPRVVEVLDFGYDGDRAFYTMELLEGGDLQQRAPLPWPQACAVAREVCSALSFLHARRLLHRDLSPRNVRCAANGVAKLIDFGATSPFGPNKLLVGTPPCCAPESVNLQALDARTDLYALGASLYFALTGQHAYPAHSMQQLPELWSAGFVSLAQLVSDIPPALDHLVRDLLRLDPNARPASAWEVVQRLSAIDGVPFDSSLPMAQAYLATPTLLGRDELLSRISRRLARVAAGTGSSLLLTGAPGIGRSRLLDTALLRATLLGLTTLHANADDTTLDYAVVRSLVRQLARVAPDVAARAAEPHRHVLRYVAPELAAANDNALQEAVDVRFVRPRLQQALLEWFRAVAREHPLLIAVDDFDRIDEPSAALLAVLASDVAAQPIVMLTSMSSEPQARTADASALLRTASTLQTLGPLQLDQTEQLFRELFGEQPTLQRLARGAHALASGNPRDLLRIAQHLLDRGVIRFEAGAFAVPPLDALELPSSTTAALEARIARLSPSALELGCAIALVPDQSYSLAECVTLSEAASSTVLADLDSLILAEIVRRVGDEHKLAQRPFGPLLSAAVPATTQRHLHARLAGIFAGRGDEFREAQQWFAAGEPARALDLLIDFVKRDMEALSKHPGRIRFAQLRAPVVGWRDTYAEALRACHELDRPRSDRMWLLLRVVGLGAITGNDERECLRELLDMLARDSALAEWVALGDQLEPAARLTAAFQNTQQRFEAMSPHERCNDPISSLHALARNIGSAMAMIPMTHDIAFLREMPNLAPFALLSPALASFAQLQAGILARLTGRHMEAHRIYSALLERLRQPDRSGLEPLNAEYVELGIINALGLLEAATGLPGTVRWATEMESHPAFEAHAVSLLRLHALFEADVEAGDRLLARLQRVRIQGGSRQMLESSHLLVEAEAHARAEDLRRLHQVADEIARLAERYPGWQPVLDFARAAEHRIRKASAQALRAVEAGLSLVAAGEHQAWAPLAWTHLLVLDDLGRYAEAAEHGERYLEQAQRQLGFEPAQLALANALVRAHAGLADAAALADAVLTKLHQHQATALHLGFAHEVCARIALTLADTAAFERHFAACKTLYCAHRHPALVAKLERLRQELLPGVDSADALRRAPVDAATVSRVISELERCSDAAEHARCALDVFARHTGAKQAFLFDIVDGELQCAAQLGESPLDAELTRIAHAFLEQQLTLAETTVGDELSSLSDSRAELGGERHTPLALIHNEGPQSLLTGLVLLCNAPHPTHAKLAPLATEISRQRAHHGCQSLHLNN